jgi:pimeloyl-ACP methyl ester carboxylesterase
MSDLPPITSVVGGVDGLAAEYADIRSLADMLDGIGSRARHWAGSAGSALIDVSLLTTASLAPGSFARVEGALLAAGGHGIVDSAVWEVDATGCRLSVEALEEADEAARTAMDGLDYALGRALGAPLMPVALAVDAVPDPLWDRLIDRVGPVGSGQPGALDELVVDHPGLTRHLLNGSGGLLDGLTLGPLPLVEHMSVESAAAEASTWYDVPGHAAVTTGPSTPSIGAHALADVVATLEAVNDGPDGTIAVQTLAGLDGPLHVVYLPGTDALGLPWDFDPDVRDGQTDLAAVAGLPTAYADGIRQALARAGVGDDPVLLVGHSLGGIVANQLAHDHGLNVAGVITAGSPISATPPGIPVLSLENRGDAVPMILGDPPLDTVDHVTVAFDDHEASVVGNHDLGHYVAGAQAVDASTDPSLQAQLAGWEPFLAGGTATTQEFTITRAP